LWKEPLVRTPANRKIPKKLKNKVKDKRIMSFNIQNFGVGIQRVGYKILGQLKIVKRTFC
jgi:hypothetical protein